MQVIKAFTDVEIVAALKNNRAMDEAVKFIYKNYYSLLEYYVVTNKGTKDDAADVIQETIVAFIEIVQKDKFRGEASVKSFLYTLTRNLWLTELRKRNSTETRNEMFEKNKDVIEQEVVHHLIYREHQKTIYELFERLGDKCKTLLLLVYYEDLSMKDILDKMPEYQNDQTLRNKKYKCMKQLEQMIQDNEPLKLKLKNALKYAG